MGRSPQALAGGTCLKILRTLLDGLKSVGELAGTVDASPYNISKHLRVLSAARIVTNEFLWETEIDDALLEEWLTRADATGLICTHTGTTWQRSLADGRFALNGGVVGKPDHDGDPAVHFAVVEVLEKGFARSIERVSYDAEAWTRQLRARGRGGDFHRAAAHRLVDYRRRQQAGGRALRHGSGERSFVIPPPTPSSRSRTPGSPTTPARARSRTP